MTNENTGGVANNLENVDRDIPNLKTRKKKNNITKLILIIGLLVGVIALAGGITLFLKRLEQNKHEEIVERDKEHPKESGSTTKDFDSTKKRIKKEEAAFLPPPASALSQGSNPGFGTGIPSDKNRLVTNNSNSFGAGATTQNAKPIETRAERRLEGSVLVNLFGDSSSNQNVSAIPSNVSTAIIPCGDNATNKIGGTSLPAPAPPRSDCPPKDGFDEKLKPSQLVAGVAAQRPNLSFLMRRGTSIQCGQKTRIVTTYPGLVSCQVSKDVYSANGEVLLIERGSEAFGEQRRALVQGQALIEVLWTRIDTPSGVAIDVNSLGTDTLGASGQPASVDNHILQRFGGAVLLSLISDIGQALANQASSSGGQIKLSSTSTAGQDIAAKTLDNTINIPPTAYSLQGSAINIFVARDIDFRSVYDLARY